MYWVIKESRCFIRINRSARRCCFPIVVFGYEPYTGKVHIADRANVELIVSVDELAVARGRNKKDKHRLLTLDAPTREKLRRTNFGP